VRGLIKRWWFWLGICFCHVAIAAGYLLIPLNPPRISQANLDKIQLGWTWEQVTELLGHASFSLDYRFPDYSTWLGDDGSIINISFKSSINDNGTVVTLVIDKQFLPTKLSSK
jgi:hypothetical protein